MESRRHILPSNHHLSLDDPSIFQTSRRPLSEAAGNSQLHTLASSYPGQPSRTKEVGCTCGRRDYGASSEPCIYHGSKGTLSRADRPYPMPTLPSQPARPPLRQTLEYRRHRLRDQRQQRHQRHGRSSIEDSPQYQAYRARQNREGNESEQKWPAILEDAFLDGN